MRDELKAARNKTLLELERDRLRDAFAMAALTGIQASVCSSVMADSWNQAALELGMNVNQATAWKAYKLADAMLEARKESGQ